jgi:hypothetical protein
MSYRRIPTQGPKLAHQTYGHVLYVYNHPHTHHNLLYEMHKDGSPHTRGVAVPKHRGDLLRLVAALLAPEFGELASQALVASLLENMEN